MGYRSDVTIITYPSIGHEDKFAALKLYVDENLPDEFEVIGEGDRRYLHCNIEGRKWYDSYEEVDAYNKAFSEWDDMFSDPDRDPTRSEHKAMFQYEFMRIGEEYEDVEYHSSYGADHALNMSRETYIDF
jgi:hypothetical protein